MSQDKLRHEARCGTTSKRRPQSGISIDERRVGDLANGHRLTAGSPLSPAGVLPLQRSAGNKAVQRLLAQVQRKISFDNGASTVPVIPDNIIAAAKAAGPQVWQQVLTWFQSSTTNTNFTSWGEVLAEAKRLHEVPIVWGNPNEFDANASDSDSETENTRLRQRRNATGAVNYHAKVRNVTKSMSRRQDAERRITKRDASGRRVVPKVDNRAYSHADIAALQADAKVIHDVIPERDSRGKSNRSYGATTIVCVALRQSDGRLRKMAFCNKDGPMPPTLRAKAEELGYQVGEGLQSHAEGELLQYLHQRGEVYTLYDMGCDKPHCKECNWGMRKTLGDYPTQTEKSDATYTKYYIPEPLADALGQDFTFSNTPAAMKRHKKPPPKKRRLNPPAASDNVG